MLDLTLDLAELLLVDPGSDTFAQPRVDRTEPVDRFLEGMCRSVGALAGCLLSPAGATDAPPQPHGLVGRNDDALAALRTFLGIDRKTSSRGYRWIRDHQVPDHCGLMIEMPVARGLGHVLLVFARDHLEEEEVVMRVISLAPGFGMMAGAMHEVATGLSAVERHHQALSAVLRQSECGIVVVGSDQSVIFVNPVAQAILDDGDGIELRRRMLRPTRYQEAVKFQAALDAVIVPPAHLGRARARGLMMMLERPGPQRPLIAVIAPIGDHLPQAYADALRRDEHAIGSHGTTGQDLRCGPDLKVETDDHDHEAAAIICLMRPECSVTRGLEPICQLHGLSPVETQLVAFLTRGLTLGEAATHMRIKPDTARTYLKQVFAKTDTHRQTDLLQLILRYQRAVIGDALFEAA